METNIKLSSDIEAALNLFNIHDMPLFLETMEKFRLFLTEENEKYNLTRLTGPDEFWIKHVIDSLYIANFFPEIKSASLKIADIGAGAGFPSIVLAAAFPALKLTAVDSSHKKTDFMRRASGVLKLKNLAVATARAREISVKQEWRNSFEIITARAVSTCWEIFCETRPMLKKKGKYVFYKTPRQVEAELCEIRNLSKISGFKWECTENFSLPQNLGERTFIYGF
jgi:16S rRNA (guanine527-N7)-methyltransferase